MITDIVFTGTVRSFHLLAKNRISLALDANFVANLNKLFVSITLITPAELRAGPALSSPIGPESDLAPTAAGGLLKTEGSVELLQLGNAQTLWREIRLEPSLADAGRGNRPRALAAEGGETGPWAPALARRRPRLRRTARPHDFRLRADRHADRRHGRTAQLLLLRRKDNLRRRRNGWDAHLHRTGALDPLRAPATSQNPEARLGPRPEI